MARPATALALAIAIAIAAGATAACVDFDVPEGVIACGEAGCPADLVCHTDGLCYAEPPATPDPGGEAPEVPLAGRNVALAAGNLDAPSRVYAYCAGFIVPVWSSPEPMTTMDVAWGDVDRDGQPELAIANDNDLARVYDFSGADFELWWASPTALPARSVAFADYDGDTDDDLAIASRDDLTRVYQSIYAERDFRERWQSDLAQATSVVSWGAIDPDGALALAIGGPGEPVRVFEHRGGGGGGGRGDSNFSLQWESLERDATEDVQWVDYDGDGDLDLSVANWGQPNRIYTNRGDDVFELAWSSAETLDQSTSLAWADIDGDGDPDLAVGNEDQPNRVYRNDGGLLQPVWTSPEADDTESVHWGDYDGDGDPDLAVGNDGQPNRLYRNTNGVLELVWTSPETDRTRAVRWATWTAADDEPTLCDAVTPR